VTALTYAAAGGRYRPAVSGKVRALSAGLLVALLGQQGCVTARVREKAGEGMMFGGGLLTVLELYAFTPCDPGDPERTGLATNCSDSARWSESAASAAIAVTLGVGVLGAILYASSLGHQSSTITPTLAPQQPPPPPLPSAAPSAPIEPLPPAR
jgi:hypothetical protein